MLKLAVVGKDVSQSLSPRMHTFILQRMGVSCTYECVSIPPEAFASRAEELFSRFDAFNVTIPFKGEIVPFLSGLCGDAAVFGAVNTVLSRERAGYNTDGFGFLLMLQNEGIALAGKRALVLGAGGAGRSCIKKLLDAGAQVSAFERDRARLAAVHREFGSFTPLDAVPLRPYDLIVNCTGVGMHASVGQTPAVTYEGGVTAPVGAELLSGCAVAVDLIYEPARSAFLAAAEQLGKRTVNGAAMLFYQAYMADCIFLQRREDAAEAAEFYRAYREESV